MLILLQLILGYLIIQCDGDSNYLKDYPQYKICLLPEHHPTYLNPKAVYQYLNRTLQLYKRCTHIFGNLVLHGLAPDELGRQPDLSFLESIQEISGSLKIFGNTVKRIAFPKLKVIRGYSFIQDGIALEIYHNENNVNSKQYLEELDMSNLKLIQNGGVQISSNPGLRFLDDKVNWHEIVVNSKLTQISVDPSKKLADNETIRCHPSCKPWPDNKYYCFGPKENQCQQRTKCSKTSRKTWCHYDEKEKEMPCDKECLGGCTNQSASGCTTCRYYYRQGECVNTCSAHFTYIFGHSRKLNDMDKRRYSVGPLCTSKCPNSLLYQDSSCVFICDFDKYYKYNNQCIRCPHNKCYKRIEDVLVCDLQRLDSRKFTDRSLPMNAALLRKLDNCTTLVGDLLFTEDSSEEITVPMLYKHLARIKVVVGDIDIYSNKIESATFLENVEELRGYYMHKKTSYFPGLKIMGAKLKYLGLKKLKKVYGLVRLYTQEKKCYLNNVPWQEITSDTTKISSCEKLPCDPICTKGCWGPGNRMCYKCEFLKADDYCVRDCLDAPGFYNPKSQDECKRCHPLCMKNCTDAGPRNCKGLCKYAIEDGECVHKCSAKSLSTKVPKVPFVVCVSCHKSCFVPIGRNVSKSACTGASNILGKGGCNVCERAINITGRLHCHKGQCPTGYYKTSISNRLIKLESICQPCSPLCSQCSGAGTKRRVCQKCRGYWVTRRSNSTEIPTQNDVCVKSCPNDVKNVTKNLKSDGFCPKCHFECKKGCIYAQSSFNCLKCRNKKVFLDETFEKFQCVKNCPSHKNYSEFINYEFLCLSLKETQKYQQKIIFIYGSLIAVGIVLIFFIILVLICNWRFRKNKVRAELKALYSNYKEPDMKSFQDCKDTRPPNMNRLQMIPVSSLEFNMNSKPLGAGAFGKVYHGYWKVKGSDDRIHKLDIVIKVIYSSTKSSIDEFLAEAQIMASVSHRYCLPIIGVCHINEKPCLISTYAKFGSLDKYLTKYKNKISSFSMLLWSEQIADGMTYLTHRSIIHRDLAARNILVCNINMVQITDFGLARLMEDTEQNLTIKTGKVPTRWLALETLLYATYSSASDVWAYGVTLWEIFTYGARPYEDIEAKNIKKYLQEGSRLPQPNMCSLNVYMVLVKCWLEDTKSRPSFNDLMNTFSNFKKKPKRYLCIEHESVPNSPAVDTNVENFCLMSVDQSRLHKDTGYEEEDDDEEGEGRNLFINRNFPRNTNKDLIVTLSHDQDNTMTTTLYEPTVGRYQRKSTDDLAFLPSRKKKSSSILSSKVKSLSKSSVNRLLSKSSSRDSKTLSMNYGDTNERPQSKGSDFQSGQESKIESSSSMNHLCGPTRLDNDLTNINGNLPVTLLPVGAVIHQPQNNVSSPMNNTDSISQLCFDRLSNTSAAHNISNVRDKSGRDRSTSSGIVLESLSGDSTNQCFDNDDYLLPFKKNQSNEYYNNDRF